jgi:hypothetical protein
MIAGHHFVFRAERHTQHAQVVVRGFGRFDGETGELDGGQTAEQKESADVLLFQHRDQSRAIFRFEQAMASAENRARRATQTFDDFALLGAQIDQLAIEQTSDATGCAVNLDNRTVFESFAYFIQDSSNDSISNCRGRARHGDECVFTSCHTMSLFLFRLTFLPARRNRLLQPEKQKPLTPPGATASMRTRFFKGQVLPAERWPQKQSSFMIA